MWQPFIQANEQSKQRPIPFKVPFFFGSADDSSQLLKGLFGVLEFSPGVAGKPLEA